MTIFSLDVLLSQFGTSQIGSISSSICCFLTCIQIPQEAGQVVRHSHHFKNFPEFVVVHTIKSFGIVNKAVLLPGKSHGRRSLVGCSPWGREESDTTELLHFHFSLSCIGEGNVHPLQCYCLESPRDGGGCWAAVSGVAQSQTRLKRLSSSCSSRCFSVNGLLFWWSNRCWQFDLWFFCPS